VSIDTLALFQSLIFKRARGDWELAARDLFRQVYSDDIKYVPADAFDDKAAYLIALTRDDELVASLRFLGPELRPFEIEDHCDLSKILGPNRVPALIGRLAVKREHRKVPGSIVIHFGLLKLAIAYGARFGVTDLFLYTLSHLVRFYEAAFFNTVGVTFTYEALRETMHIMRLDIKELERPCTKVNSRRARLILMSDTANVVV
jgi:predicted GNAT family N-acyltransferase